MSQDLRARFSQLRSEDESAAPDFQSMIAEARVTPIQSHRRWRRWSAIGGGLAAAAAAALLLLGPDRSSEQQFTALVNSYAANTAWTSPTDALLDVPGNHVLSTVPSISMPSVLGPISSLDTL